MFVNNSDFPRVLSFGSLNIDYVYDLPHIVRPGETLAASQVTIHAGGKGLNQSLAMARAGLSVTHAGRVGPQGLWLLDVLTESGVDCRGIHCCEDEHTGHAMILVEAGGQNSIVLYGGANQGWTEAAIEALFVAEKPAAPKIWSAVVCQNETNGLDKLLACAQQRQVPVIFNAAPYSLALQRLDLSTLHTLLVNETEAIELAGCDVIDEACAQLKCRYPQLRLVVTLGGDGLWASYQGQDYHLAALPADLVDSTAAGDTFTGYYVASILRQQPGDFLAALHLGRQAAALAVSRAGAAPSIPYLSEL